MKKIYNLILTAALILCAVACVEHLGETLPEEQVIPADARVSVVFGVPSETATRADMANEPTIESMHVFVFSKVGVLIEAVPARRFGNVTTNGVDGAQFWVADMQMGAAERHVHFIANLPSNYAIPTSGSEASILQSITTKAPAAAYWQRVVLEKGITAYRYDGGSTYSYVNPETGETMTVAVPGTYNSADQTYTYEDDGAEESLTVYKGDYINTNGHKVLDGKGLYASKETSEAVSMVPMIRNFARIKVKSSWSGFTINQVALVNTPKEGFISPFNEAKNEFVAPYLNAGTTALSEDAITATGYAATIPTAGIDKATPSSFLTEKDSEGYFTLFMYERGVPASDATCVLLQGTRNETSRWYKIEITDETGEYFPIYRDFTYKMDIKSISGSEGYKSAADANAAAPLGDISSSTETATLEQITDGKGLTLHVEYIDYTDMDANPATHTTTLLYKCYYTPTTGAATNLTDKVDLSIVPYTNVDPAVISVSTAAYSGTSGTPDGSAGWYQATVTLAGVGGTMKKSDIHVEANLSSTDNPGGYAKKISRDVTYRVLPKSNLGVSASSLASDAANQSTTVSITLPANLGYSVFPITLMIESANNCLTSDVLSVETGKSLKDGTTNTFYFLKTISHSEYEASSDRIFTCDFKTTKSGGKGSTIYVKDKGGRFDLAETTLN